MGKRKKKSKDRKVLLNYDSSRYEVPVARLQPVRVVKSDGTDEFILLVPANELEGKSEEEINRNILDRFRIFTFIRSFKWEELPPDERILPDLVSRFTWLTARAIAINAFMIYVERARTEEVIDRRKKPDSDTAFHICNNLTERIYFSLHKTIMNSKDSVKALDRQLFSNMLASAILNIHRQQGSVFSMPAEDVEKAVQSHLKERGLEPYERTIESMAESYAAQLLDSLCPVKMSIEELRSFVLAKVDSATILSLSELNRFLINLQRSQGKEIICRIEGNGKDIQIGLRLKSPIDPSKVIDGPIRERSYTKDHFRELAVAAVKEMAKGTRSLTKKHLCEKLGISDTTLGNYLKDDPTLWPSLQRSYLEVRLKKIEGI
ncbi:MAG TPA: hypothetical protein VLR90_03075 [Blastocatellia bacterium]|nr:hypothetical protein [Blastocatellia bacterium]